MMVSLVRLTVLFSVKTTITVRQSKSIEDREIGKNVRPCGESWLTNSKFSSLIEMTKVHSSSQRSTLAHMSSALKIEQMELEIRCSNLLLLLLEAGKHLPLLHMSCLSLVFLLTCCNVFSLKPTRSMCDGRSLASPLFRRLAGRGALFRGFPFRWVLHFVLSLTRGVTLHDSASCSREDSLDECRRPCDALPCLLFPALWLQATQSAKATDLTCFKTFPITAVTCLQVGPTSFDWPVDPVARFDQSRPSSSPDEPTVEQQRGAFPASTRSRWRHDALQPPQVLQGIAGWDTCGHFLDGGLRCSTWNMWKLPCFCADFPDLRCFLRFPAANNTKVLFQFPHVPVGDRMLFQAQPHILQHTTGWDGCGPFLSESIRCMSRNTRGLVGSVFSRQRNREFKLVSHNDVRGSRLKFGVRCAHFTSSHASSSCAHVVCLILRDSPFIFLLSTFPPIVFFIYLVFSFFFHDVEYKYPVHSR